MMNLRGFLWSMGRCATKAVSETISRATEAEATSWIDTPRMAAAPHYFLRTYPMPFVLTLHHPQQCDAFAALVAAHRNLPVVLTLRDPIANLESYAKTFFTSFVARRVDEATKRASAGVSVLAAINPKALDEWLMPTADLWRQYSAVKDSPHLILDFSALQEAGFVETMTRVCDFLRLAVKSPIVWTSEANTECDRFLVGYVRTFALFDRRLELRFSRWPDHWSESGLVTLGTLESAVLEEMMGAAGPLYVHAKTDQLLTEGRLAREREAFAALLAEPGMSDKIAAQVAADCRQVAAIVARELPALQEALIKRFMATSRDGVRRLLKLHPDLETHWDRWRVRLEKQAA